MAILVPLILEFVTSVRVELLLPLVGVLGVLLTVDGNDIGVRPVGVMVAQPVDEINAGVLGDGFDADVEEAHVLVGLHNGRNRLLKVVQARFSLCEEIERLRSGLV